MMMDPSLDHHHHHHWKQDTTTTMTMTASASSRSTKADRLDSIVGDVLARQCSSSSSSRPVPHHQLQGQGQAQDQVVVDGDGTPGEADVPLHEWVTALTHPVLGPYPNGVTPRILDRLAAETGVSRFPDHARRRWHKMWSSSNHLCVYLSDEVKCGRLRRVRFGHYAGCFDTAGIGTCAVSKQSSSSTTGDDAGPNGGQQYCGDHHHHNTDSPKEEAEGCDWPEPDAIESGGQSGGAVGSFPITGLAANVTAGRARSSSMASSGHLKEDRRIKKDEPPAPPPKRQRLQSSPRRPAALVLDEFGLPSLLQQASFSNLVLAMGADVQAWSVQQSAKFALDFGFPDGADAFRREEIDGTALLLLRRADVLDGLRLKIGPAVKFYRHIRALQRLVCRKTTITTAGAHKINNNNNNQKHLQQEDS